MTTENEIKFKWTEENTAQLRASVSDITDQVPYALVEQVAEEIGTSTRSIAAKLRSLDYNVEAKGARAPTFTAEDTEALKQFLASNAGVYDVSTLATAFLEGKYTSKQLQGKVLALELTEALIPTPKKVAESKYTPDQETQIIALALSGAFIEDIAEAVTADVRSVRGKLLSLLRKEVITSIPKSKNPTKASVTADPFDGIAIAESTVAEIAAKVGKTERGVKAMLTRRGVSAKDYKAKVKAEAAAE